MSGVIARAWITAAAVCSFGMSACAACSQPSDVIARDGAAPAPRRDAGPPRDAHDGGGASVPYSKATFRASHNSYALAPLTDQLDDGVRFLELDIHDDDFASTGDYRVGHDEPGHAVSRDGTNPDTLALRAWLDVIASWSATSPTHAPITIGIDLKDNLADNRSYADGNLARLDAELDEAFGATLFSPDDLGDGWPSVDALRGRVIVVLTGSQSTRLAYRRDRGTSPAVAMDVTGRVVVVHDWHGADLWYWTGRRFDDGSVAFYRHGWIGEGQSPAVAIGEGGVVIVVYRTPGAVPQLQSRLGRIDGEHETTFGEAQPIGMGTDPTVRFVAANEVTEIHRSPATGDAWRWTGTVDPAAGTVTWSGSGRTGDAPFAKAVAEVGARRITVASMAHGPTPDDVLVYTTELAAAPTRIRYAQRAFVEYQRDDDPDLLVGAELFAVSAGFGAWGASWRSMGKVVRLWGFNSVLLATDPPPNFAATDQPLEPWYDEYCASVGTIE